MRHSLKTIVLAASAALVLAACDTKVGDEPIAEDHGVGHEQIMAADTSGWVTHGGNYSETRHSPLAQVNADNVDQLGLAWSYDLGTSRGIEATPIIHDGMIYVTSTWNVVHALDARTGAVVWTHDPEIDKKQAAYGCCDVVNRGVAIWGGNVFTATMDGRLIAMDAKTGAVKWDVLTIDKSKPYTITGAPRIIKGKVIIGNGGAELGVRGYFSAYDADSGEMIWRFYTVPGNPAEGFENKTMEMAAKTWTGEYWKAGGGGTSWDSMAYDPELDLLYVGVGNGSPWNQKIRSPEGGDNLFLSSMVAVRPDSGEYVWHYQTTPGETWDFTATQHMILADLEIDGAVRKVIMQAPKNGFFYVIDRETGEFISGKNFVPVNWATHIDETTGRPVEVPEARYSAEKPYQQLPGPLGAHNWHPMSFSPKTGLVYIPAQQAPWVYAGQQAEDFEYKPGLWNTGTRFRVSAVPADKMTFKMMKATMSGSLMAWDPVKQEQAWKFEHNGPWNGGILSTAGDLVFQGTADAHFAAYNAATGERKWRYFTQTGIVAAPVTYELDGEQYVAVAAGYGGAFVLGYQGIFPSGSAVNVGRLLVFKLGADGNLPELVDDTIDWTLPEKTDASAETIEAGLENYMTMCVTCHGDQAFSSGLIPNLRYSAATKDAELWNEIVRDGALHENGMPKFSAVLDEASSEAIRAYIINEAHEGLQPEFYDEVMKEK